MYVVGILPWLGSEQWQATSLAEVLFLCLLVCFRYLPTPKLGDMKHLKSQNRYGLILWSLASNAYSRGTSAFRASTSEATASGGGEIGRMFQWLIFLHCNEAVASLTKALPPHLLVSAGIVMSITYLVKKNLNEAGWTPGCLYTRPKYSRQKKKIVYIAVGLLLFVSHMLHRLW